MHTRKIRFGNIYTPQGPLRKVMKRPNLDLMMNLFRIPRAYAVSGFGDWDVGRHSLCTAFIALKWAQVRRMRADARNELVTLALLHDLHEAVTGDILPFFKTQGTKEAIASIQNSFLHSLNLALPPAREADLKIADMAAFLYEITQSPSAPLRTGQAKWLKKIYARQKGELLKVAKQYRISQMLVKKLLKELGL